MYPHQIQVKLIFVWNIKMRIVYNGPHRDLVVPKRDRYRYRDRESERERTSDLTHIKIHMFFPFSSLSQLRVENLIFHSLPVDESEINIKLCAGIVLVYGFGATQSR